MIKKIFELRGNPTEERQSFPLLCYADLQGFLRGIKNEEEEEEAASKEKKVTNAEKESEVSEMGR